MKILAAVLIVLAAILFSPLVLKLSYEESLSAELRFLSFRFPIAPPPPKKEKPEKKKGRGKNDIGKKIGALFREKGPGGFLKILGRAADIAGKTAKGLFSHLTFSEFLLDFSVGEADAAETAVAYGRASGAVASAAGVFFEKAKCRKYAVRVSPDFSSGKSSVKFRMTARIPVVFAIGALLQALVRSVSLVRSLKTPQAARTGRQPE